MRSKLSPRCGVFLASLLLLWGGTLGSIAQAAPTVTIVGLNVNNVNKACGSTVMGGDTVCVRFTTSESGFAKVFVTKNNVKTQTDSGNVTAGPTWISCVIAGSDAGTRTFTVEVTGNTSGMTGSATGCTYVVGTPPPPTTGPTLTILGLVVNETDKPCGSTVGTGDQVCLKIKSDQDASVTITVQKGSTVTTVVSNGTIVANTETTTGCVTAGTADGITRTYTVTISNTNGSDSKMCTYIVGSSTAMAPTLTILGLRVNGVTKACMSHVNPGDTVCVRFQTDQTATATVTVQKGTGTPTTVASGTVSPGPVWIACVTAGTADGITRTFTVTLTNTNGMVSDTCTYIVP